MDDRVRFLVNRVRERLWVKPLAMCVLSTAGAFLAKAADRDGLGQYLPSITVESTQTLLTTLSASMLVIATFAVGSMVSAYASASQTATPRSFALVVSDDVSQNALSTFVGAFIFSIVALIALQNDYYDNAGRFALTVLTLVVFAIVIVTFVRWVDRIARLGRMGSTIEKVEAATAAAIRRRRRAPALQAVPAESDRKRGPAVYGDAIGYVQHVDVAKLQAYAEEIQAEIVVAALPGTFAAPGRALAHLEAMREATERDAGRVSEAFLIGDSRVFDDDPRFGLVVLSEIATRALSPAVNDPGTAIQIIGAFVRLFSLWAEPVEAGDVEASDYDLVKAPELSLQDMFVDAFTSISRDGAHAVEVVVRLQKALASLASIDDPEMRVAATRHARQALARAESALELPEDVDTVREVARWCHPS